MNDRFVYIPDKRSRQEAIVLLWISCAILVPVFVTLVTVVILAIRSQLAFDEMIVVLSISAVFLFLGGLLLHAYLQICFATITWSIVDGAMLRENRFGPFGHKKKLIPLQNATALVRRGPTQVRNHTNFSIDLIDRRGKATELFPLRPDFVINPYFEPLFDLVKKHTQNMRDDGHQRVSVIDVWENESTLRIQVGAISLKDTPEYLFPVGIALALLGPIIGFSALIWGIFPVGFIRETIASVAVVGFVVVTTVFGIVLARTAYQSATESSELNIDMASGSMRISHDRLQSEQTVSIPMLRDIDAKVEHWNSRGTASEDDSPVSARIELRTSAGKCIRFMSGRSAQETFWVLQRIRRFLKLPPSRWRSYLSPL